uniref:Uncharacterized protein n=1 Tax=Setaria italica TaxID=4555 RepID=K3YXC3_SETIT
MLRLLPLNRHHQKPSSNQERNQTNTTEKTTGEETVTIGFCHLLIHGCIKVPTEFQVYQYNLLRKQKGAGLNKRKS